MKLQRQVQVAASLAAGAVLLVITTLLVGAQQLTQAQAQHRYVDTLNALGISGLRTLTTDYLLNPGPRPRLQWWQRHQSLALLLQRPPVDSAAQLALIDAIRLRHRYVGELFPKLTALREGPVAADLGTQQRLHQVESRLVSQMLIATEDMVHDTRLLLELSLDQSLHAQRRAAVVLAVAVAALALLMAAGIVLAVRGVVRPIRAMQHQAALIGSGQFERRIRLVVANEIGDLSRAIDDMAQQLAIADAALRARTAELEDLNKDLESFSYSVSHDLRAPLRGIDGWSLALTEDLADKLDDGTRRHLDFIRGEAQRMGRLIDDLLALSRVGRQELVRQVVDLSQLAGEVAARLLKAQPERAIEIVVEPGLTAFADSHLLEIVLSNLLDNACKFTAKLAQARVQLKRGDAGAAAAAGQAVFCVSDNGAGFDMAHAGMLFGAFQRLHRASEFPGTGIGLATCQRIVHRHGGRLWAEAAVGQGARFYFSLPEAT